MFEKEAEDKAFEKYPLSDRCDRIDLERNLKYEEGFKEGAEFGYNKAKEEAKDIINELLMNGYSENTREEALNFLYPDKEE